MAEIVNLKRARKAKARDEAERKAEANRVKHGVAKSTRKLAEQQKEKSKRDVEAHRLDDDE